MLFIILYLEESYQPAKSSSIIYQIMPKNKIESTQHTPSTKSTKQKKIIKKTRNKNYFINTFICKSNNTFKQNINLRSRVSVGKYPNVIQVDKKINNKTNKIINYGNFKNKNVVKGINKKEKAIKKGSSKKKTKIIDQKFYQIDQVLKHRVSSDGYEQYFVSWVGYAPSYNSWVDKDRIKGLDNTNLQQYLQALSIQLVNQEKQKQETKKQIKTIQQINKFKKHLRYNGMFIQDSEQDRMIQHQQQNHYQQHQHQQKQQYKKKQSAVEVDCPQIIQHNHNHNHNHSSSNINLKIITQGKQQEEQKKQFADTEQKKIFLKQPESVISKQHNINQQKSQQALKGSIIQIISIQEDSDKNIDRKVSEKRYQKPVRNLTKKYSKSNKITSIPKKWNTKKSKSQKIKMINHPYRNKYFIQSKYKAKNKVKSSKTASTNNNKRKYQKNKGKMHQNDNSIYIDSISLEEISHCPDKNQENRAQNQKLDQKIQSQSQKLSLSSKTDFKVGVISYQYPQRLSKQQLQILHRFYYTGADMN